MNEKRLFMQSLRKADPVFIPPHEFANAILHLSHHEIDTHLHPRDYVRYKSIVKSAIGTNPKLTDDSHQKLLESSFGDSSSTLANILKAHTNLQKTIKILEAFPKTEIKTEPVELHKYGALSDAAYTHHNKGDVLAALKKSPLSEVHDFVVDSELSNADDLVLHNSITNETVISYRGTQKLSDWHTNIQAATSIETHSPLVKSAIKTANSVVAKYGTENIAVTGHSMGGMRSLEVAHTLDAKGINVKGYHFDPGVSIRQMLNQNKTGTLNQTIYRTHFDAPSVTAKVAQLKPPKNLEIINVATSTEVPMKTAVLDTHSITHFKPSEIVGFDDVGNVLVTRHTNTQIVANALRSGENLVNLVANKPVVNQVLRYGGELAEKSAAPLAVAGTAYDVYKDITNPNKSKTEKVADVGVDTLTGVSSWVAGNAAGEVAMAATLVLCPECALVGAGVGLLTGVGVGVGVSSAGAALKGTAEKQLGKTEQFFENTEKKAETAVENFGENAYEKGKETVASVRNFLGI